MERREPIDPTSKEEEKGQCKARCLYLSLSHFCSGLDGRETRSVAHIDEGPRRHTVCCHVQASILAPSPFAARNI